MVATKEYEVSVLSFDNRLDQIETFSIFSTTAIHLLSCDIVDLYNPQDWHQVVHDVPHPCVDNRPEGVLLERPHAAVAIKYAREGDDNQEEQVNCNAQQTGEYHNRILPFQFAVILVVELAILLEPHLKYLQRSHQKYISYSTVDY